MIKKLLFIFPLIFVALTVYGSSGIPYIDPGTATPTPNRVAKFNNNGYLNVGSQLSVGTLTTKGTGTGNFTGTVTAAYFAGDASGLTNIPGGSFATITGSATSTQLPLISGLLGSATSAQLPAVMLLFGTSTITNSSTNTVAMQLNTAIVASVIGTETVLLLNCNNPGTSTFLDSSNTRRAVTANGAAIGTTTAKFGTGSYLGNGTNTSLSIAASADTTFGTGDFTLETFVYMSATPSESKALFTNRDGGGTADEFIVLIDTNGVTRFYSGVGGISDGTISVALGTWTHVAVARQGTSLKNFVGGISTSPATSSHDFSANNPLSIGGGDWGSATTKVFNGLMDEPRVTKGVAKYTSDFTPPLVPFAGSSEFTQYTTRIKSPTDGVDRLVIVSNGTETESTKSYIYCNATTTVFGAGTSSAPSGTTTPYSGWFDGAVRATAFNVASTEKIKENIKPIKTKPSNLEAEGLAKIDYVGSRKAIWISDNEANYTYVGSDTATHIDTAQMEAGYTNYIEQAWAADPNQPSYIKAVQKAGEKLFWSTFDTVQPKSWNPKEALNITRRGFVVEEMPDVVKGQDGQSIDPMALIAYMSEALQSLKQETIIQYKALNEFIKTGTITSQLEIEERLEVLRGVP